MKRRWLRFILGTIGWLSIPLLWTFAQPCPNLPPNNSIANLSCPRPGVATSGQPTAEGVEWIAKQGYKAVINFRTEKEEGANISEEMALAKKLGMRYVHIPVTLSTLTDEKVGEFLAAMNDPQNHPVYIHCLTANRVGTFWMIYLTVHEGMSPVEAEREARGIGLNNDRLISFARDYIERHPVPAKPEKAPK